MKTIVAFTALFIFCRQLNAQTIVSVDTSEPEIKAAVTLLSDYLNEFRSKKLPDFKKYWSEQDCNRSKIPDDIIYAITSDGVTYNFSKHPMIFYARLYKDYVHLKTLFHSIDSEKVTVWAITNHYVQKDADGRRKFISEMELHQENYQKAIVENITYHFPNTHRFDTTKAMRLIEKLRRIEREWNFKPILLDYFFADSRDQLEKMRGMDYCFGMDDANPSGISFYQTKTVFCQGLDEDYLHEVLHIYFDTVYSSSPLRHGLIYLFAGSIGKDFNWLLKRMSTYLKTHPKLDLTHYDTLWFPDDKMLRPDNVINGWLCKIIYEKEGLKGLKRLLSYPSIDEVFEKEFLIKAEERNDFLKRKLKEF